MPGIKTALFFAVQALILAVLLNRTPTMAPTSGKPWADGPCPLVTTPQYATKKVFPIVRSLLNVNG